MPWYILVQYMNLVWTSVPGIGCVPQGITRKIGCTLVVAAINYSTTRIQPISKSLGWHKPTFSSTVLDLNYACAKYGPINVICLQINIQYFSQRSLLFLLVTHTEYIFFKTIMMCINVYSHINANICISYWYTVKTSTHMLYS